MLSFFPLLNIIFLVLIYRVHRQVFWFVGFIQVCVCLSGILYIEANFNLAANKFLYYFALTGLGGIIGVAGFFVAVSLNHRGLYEDTDNEVIQKP